MNELLLGDSLDILKTLDANTIDAMVTDPPAGIGFMGKTWDSHKGGRKEWIAWLSEVMGEALRVMKPGAYGLVWALPRTSHWTGMALEDAGFEIRDCIYHVFGSGFPKSSRVNISPKFCQCALTAHNDENTNPSQPPGGHNSKEIDVLDDGRSQQGAQRSKNVGADSQDGYRQGRDLDGGLLQGNELPGQESSPSLECAQVHTRSALHDDVQAVESLHSPSSALYSDPLSIQDCSHQCVTDTEKPDILSGHKSPCCSYDKADHKQHNLDSSYSQSINGFPVCQTCGNPNANGWGTALKPAVECWWLVRKPLTESTVARNVLEYGTGALNIDASRIEGLSDKELNRTPQRQSSENPIQIGGAKPGDTQSMYSPSGRWPSHLIHDGSDEILEHFPQVAGKKPFKKLTGYNFDVAGENKDQKYESQAGLGEIGSAARFFYCAKPSRRERNEGLDDKTNGHPTVKSQSLMKYLIRLITPPDGVVLDPFMGSGSTGVACKTLGYDFVGIELDPEYLEIASARIDHAEKESVVEQLDLLAVEGIEKEEK